MPPLTILQSQWSRKGSRLQSVEQTAQEPGHGLDANSGIIVMRRDPAPKRTSKALYRTELIDGASRDERPVCCGERFELLPSFLDVDWPGPYPFSSGAVKTPGDVKIRHDSH